MHNIAVRRVCRRPLTPAQAPAAVGADIAASSPQGACRRLPPCGHRRCRRNSHRGQGLQPACTPPSLCTRPPPCHRPWRLLRHASSRKRPAVQPPNPVVTVPDPWPAGLVVAGRRPLRRAARDVSAASSRVRPTAQPPDPAVAVPNSGHPSSAVVGGPALASPLKQLRRPEPLKDVEECNTPGVNYL